MPRRPAVYVCAQDRRGGRVDGPERLFAIINAPAREVAAEQLDRAQQWALELLGRCGLHLEPPPEASAVGPVDLGRLYPGSGGALYGAAPHGWAAPLRRAGARTRLGGFYLVGGTVHPGAGVPMAALSGRLAADALLRDFGREGFAPLEPAGVG
jgi:1-hydroxycarotenoid 3,4-desaturase